MIADKLSDAQVRVMRQMRRDGASYQELAHAFECHPKTAERICRGMDRVGAHGPIEHRPGRAKGGGPFDLNELERCKGCGALVHPPCYRCVTLPKLPPN